MLINRNTINPCLSHLVIKLWSKQISFLPGYHLMLSHCQDQPSVPSSVFQFMNAVRLTRINNGKLTGKGNCRELISTEHLLCPRQKCFKHLVSSNYLTFLWTGHFHSLVSLCHCLSCGFLSPLPDPELMLTYGAFGFTQCLGQCAVQVGTQESVASL